MEHTQNADMKEQERQQIYELGSDLTKGKDGRIYTLTIIGQVEGHQVLPETCRVLKKPKTKVPRIASRGLQFAKITSATAIQP